VSNHSIDFFLNAVNRNYSKCNKFVRFAQRGGESVIYEKVAKLCVDRGISIRALELELKMGNGTIKGWEKTNPRVDLLKKVCDFFGVTLDEMMREDAANGKE
jgi:hypothetical protein